VRVPIVRERVVIEGRSVVFLVVWADPIRRVADLIPLSGLTYLEEDVPFSLIRPATEEPIRRAQPPLRRRVHS